MAETISWVATAATILAAFMTAANLGSRITGYGFVVFTFGALCWIADGWMTDQPALMWSNVALTILDLFGIWRWLGRQASVEKGAKRATQVSEQSASETLCRLSLLTGAPVTAGDRELGHCVDGMAGCSSGSIRYVVVSEGGLGGVGERLRRLPWGQVRVEGNTVVAAMTEAQFSALEELPRDQWPAR
jgi:hypothetical protein